MNILIFILIFLLAGCDDPRLAPVEDVGKHSDAKYSSWYRVQPDDTLYSIAWAYNLDYRALAQANHLTPPYPLKDGQVLTLQAVPFEEASVGRTTPATGRPRYPHKIQPYDSEEFYSSASPGKWGWPVRGHLLSRFEPGLEGNNGIDIEGNFGTPVRAAAQGKVVYAGSGLRDYGKLLILKHDSSTLSAYAYNETLLVKEGSWVSSGQIIARMGRNTSGKVMLHFEIRRNGQPINPLLYLH